MSTVNCSIEADTMRVSMSVFYDDMEVAVYEYAGKFIRLCPVKKNKKHEADSLVFSYIKDKFSVCVDTICVTMVYEGYVCGEETMDISMWCVIPPIENGRCVLYDSVLMEVYPEQRNIIQFSMGQKRESVLLSKGREKVSLDIQ